MLFPVLGIDFGTNNLSVWKKGKGLVFEEPSIFAKDIKKNKIVYMGNDALSLEGKTPENIVTIKPIERSVISEYKTSLQMINFILNKFCSGSLVKPTLIFSVPNNLSQVAERSFRNCAEECGIKNVHLVESTYLAALGHNLPVNDPGGNMVIDLGAGTVKIAILSVKGIVISETIELGGNDFNKVLQKYFRQNYNLLIGNFMAEDLKNNSISLIPNEKDSLVFVKGRDLINGNLNTIKVSKNELCRIFDNILEKIVLKINDLLEQTSPDLCGDIIERGILLTGGLSQLKGLDTFLYNNIKVPIHIDEDPMHSVIKGCGKLISTKNYFNF